MTQNQSQRSNILSQSAPEEKCPPHNWSHWAWDGKERDDGKKRETKKCSKCGVVQGRLVNK